jgi:hypothetical protein
MLSTQYSPCFWFHFTQVVDIIKGVSQHLNKWTEVSRVAFPHFQERSGGNGET